MKKKILLVLFIVFLFLGACSKEVVTSDTFKEIAKNNNMVVTDIKEQFEDDTGIKEAYIATYTDKYQVEFYTFEDDIYARGYFETTKSSAGSEGIDKHTESSDSYNVYELTTEYEYIYISRVDNTMFYAHVNAEFKDNVNKIVNELGY